MLVAAAIDQVKLVDKAPFLKRSVLHRAVDGAGNESIQILHSFNPGTLPNVYYHAFMSGMSSLEGVTASTD